MKHEYAQWIEKNVTETFCKCVETTLAMQTVFPELKRVRGHYVDVIWGDRNHWWLVDPGGHIVDPTADQFPTKGGGVYVSWNEGDPEPTGRCPYCGDECFDGKTFCSDQCAIAEEKYLNGSINLILTDS